MTPSPGDTLITLRTVGPLRRGDVVTVSGTCADGEYVYLDGHERQAFRAEHFLLAVRRPWWAWAEPGWAERALAAAEGFVRGGIVVGAAPGRDPDLARVVAACERDIEAARVLIAQSAKEHGITFIGRDEAPSPAPVATEAEIRAKAFEYIAQRLEAKASAAPLGATFWHGSLHGTSLYNFFTYAADEVRYLAAKETER